MRWWINGKTTELRGSGCMTIAVSGYVMLAVMTSLHPHKDAIGWHQKQAFEIIKKKKNQDIVYFDILRKKTVD